MEQFITTWTANPPKPFTINTDLLQRNFARMFISELTGNIYDLLNKLNDKQVNAIVRMAKKYTPANTSALNYFMKQGIIDTASFIISERKAARRKFMY